MPAELAVVASVAELLVYLVLAYLAGRLLVGLLAEAPGALLRASAPLLGAAAFALQLWLYGAIHLPWNDLTMLGPWLLAALLRRRHLLGSVAADARDLAGEIRLLLASGLLEALLTVLLAIISLVYLVNLLTQPVLGWDGIAMWLFKAKVFYLQQAVDLGPIAGDIQRNLDYPPLYPLLVDSSYVLIGHLDEVFGKSVTFLFFLTGLLAFYVTVKALLGRLPALAFSFLFAALPIFQVALFSYAQMGWADYPVGILMLVSLQHLLHGRLTGDPLSYLAAGVFAALAAVTKNEGLSFLAITVLLLLVMFAVASMRGRRPAISRSLLLLGLLWLLPVIAWQAYLRVHGIHGARLVGQQGFGQLLPALPGRAIAVLSSVRHVVSLHGDYGWIGIDLLLALLLIGFKRSRAAIPVTAAVLLQLAAYLAVYLVTPFEIGYIVNSSLDRLVLQITPSLLLLLAVALHPYLAPRSEAGEASGITGKPVGQGRPAFG
jgi:hypothetical protein